VHNGFGAERSNTLGQLAFLFLHVLNKKTRTLLLPIDLVMRHFASQNCWFDESSKFLFSL
jgi:hypothetical protein